MNFTLLISLCLSILTPKSNKLPFIVLLKDQYIPKSTDKSLRAREIIEHNSTVEDKLVEYLIENGAESVKKHSIIPAVYVEMEPSKIEELLKRSDIRYIVPSETVRIEKLIMPKTHNYGWNIHRVMADSVWENLGFTGENIIIAFIDSGVDADHPALQTKFLGYFFDAVNHLPTPYDDFGHGTHVTGTVLGGDGPGNTFPDTCDVGIAFGARFVSAKAFASDGTGTTEWILECFDWIIELIASGVDINIVSNSWGDYNETNLIYYGVNETLKELNVIPVYAIGNAGPSPHSTAVPGNYPITIGVGATDYDDMVAYFSSRGPAPNEEPWNDPANWPVYNWNLLKPDISAPGVDIRSTVPGGGYEAGWSGTSMATPHVTATIALMLEKNPSLTFEAIYEILRESADRPDSTLMYPNYEYGWGRLNTYRALLLTPSLDSPYPVTTQFTVEELYGNGNGFPEPGETLSLILQIKNLGEDFLDVTGSISIDDPLASVLEGNQYLGSIPRNQTVTSQPFTIATDSQWRDGKPLTVHITLTGQDISGNATSFERDITFEVGTPSFYTWFFDDFEGDTSYWTTGGTTQWGLVQDEYHSPTHSFADSPQGNYQNHAHTYLRLKWPLPLKNIYHARIIFWNKHYLEIGSGSIYVDKGYIEASTDSSDDAAWVRLKTIGGMEGNWHPDTVDLTPVCGEERVYIRFLLESDVSYTLDGWYVDDVEIQLDTPKRQVFLYVAGTGIIDSASNGNGVLDPGEEAILKVTIVNFGDSSTPELVGVLESESSYITVVTNYGEIGVVPPFVQVETFYTISADDDAPIGTVAPLRLILTGDNFTDTLEFNLTISDSVFLPTHDLGYGYLAVEDIDNVDNPPQIQWIELKDGLGELIEEISNGDADTTTITLPFTFRFYGQDFNEIGISSNGFIELGGATYRWGDNTPIPSPTGPSNLLAPFWDDLDTYQHGDIYSSYDEENHLFVIEFNELAHHTWPSLGYETFEVILVDPDYSNSPTDDGDIYFLYNEVSYYRSATIGIEAPGGEDGIMMNNNTIRPPTVAPPEAGRVILFTTRVLPEVSEKPATLNPKLLLYPIPASNKLILRIPGKTGIEDIRIYNVAGRLIKRQSGMRSKSERFILNVSHLKSGVYFLKINGCKRMWKFLVVR